MKLAVLAVLAGLLVPAVASADILNPPGGPVYVDDDTDAAPVQVNNGSMQRPPRAAGQGQRQRDPRVVANRQRIRASLLAEFDVNGDGKLGPRERVRAVRMLRKMEQKLAQPLARPAGEVNRQRDRQWRRFMGRYDVNRDGQVGPREVPRGAADKLRRFDRNRDGWVERNEVP
jgi:hypothetical protein